MAVVVESNVYLHIHHSATTENAHNENSMSCSSKPFVFLFAKGLRLLYMDIFI